MQTVLLTCGLIALCASHATSTTQKWALSRPVDFSRNILGWSCCGRPSPPRQPPPKPQHMPQVRQPAVSGPKLDQQALVALEYMTDNTLDPCVFVAEGANGQVFKCRWHEYKKLKVPFFAVKKFKNADACLEEKQFTPG